MKISKDQYERLQDIQESIAWQSGKFKSLLDEMKDQEDTPANNEPDSPIDPPVKPTGKRLLFV